MILTRQYTAEQLLADRSLGRCELVRGELIMMSPASPRHGMIALRLGAMLHDFVDTNKLGVAFAAETGFLLARNPDTVRAPDIAFVRADRLHLIPKRGFFPGPPDLAVEVLSPDDTASDVLAKADEWLKAGVNALWVIDPERKTIAIHRKDAAILTLGQDQTLVEPALLPGFQIRLKDLFA